MWNKLCAIVLSIAIVISMVSACATKPDQSNTQKSPVLVKGTIKEASSVTTTSPPETNTSPTNPTTATNTASGTVKTQPPPSQTTPPTLKQDEAMVTKVIDGDTIEVQMVGFVYTIRYIGIDAPEDTNDPNNTLVGAATQKNRDLVEGKVVRLEKDVSETDKYGRLLRYVYVGSLFVNAEMVRLGYAQVITYPPDTKYESLFLSAQEEAQREKRGMWASKAVTTIPPSQTTDANELSLQIIFITSPISPGDNATLTAKTLPNAECSITVYYKSGPSTASGLYTKTADADGYVSWTWKVGSKTTPGSWRIVVTAKIGDQMVDQEIYFTVQ
ncbi:MAG TPA: thermonuclease family protein [Dehalococcoidales bacterium]